MEKTIYSKFSNQRSERFAIRTDIIKKKEGIFVRKIPIGEKSKEHVLSMFEKYKTLNTCFMGSKFEANIGAITEDYFECEFVKGTSYDQLLDEKLNCHDQTGFIEMVKEYVSEINKVYPKEKFQMSEGFRNVFGDIQMPENILAAKNIDIDLVFSNIIQVENQKWIVIDYEWTYDFLIPANYLIWRAIGEFLNYVGGVRNSISEKQLYDIIGISNIEVEIFQKMEWHFQYEYCYKNTKNLYEMQKIMQGEIIHDEIFETVKVEEASSIVQIYFDKGQGYSERDSFYILSKINDAKDRCVNFEVNSDVQNVRIDPSQTCCVVKIKCLCALLTSGEKYDLSIQTNGQKISNNTVIFLTDDPQIYITNFREGTKSIEIAYCIFGFSFLPEIENGIYSFLQEIGNDLDEQKRNIEEKNVQIIEKIAQLEERDRIIRDKEKEIEDKNERIQAQENQIQNWSLRWEEIVSSNSWRITKPLRTLNEKLKSNRVTYLSGKGIKFLYKNGLKATYKKINSKIKNKKGISIPFPEIVGENEKAINNVPVLSECTKKIAVHIHLFYEELLQELLQYVKMIPYDFDLYITCQQSADINAILYKAKKVCRNKNVNVVSCVNKGRDIAPLYAELGEKIKNYEYFLHIHSKKSLYSGKERVEWRQYSLASVLGSEELVMKIFSLFENDENVGIICPDHYEDVPMLAYSWLANESAGRLLSSRLGIPFKTGIFMYPLGSFFWARTDALMPLFEAQLKWEDFDEEYGQTDGTLAHVIERILGPVIAHKGYRQIFVDYREGVFRYDFSIKAFRNYLTDLSVDTVISSLCLYDVVSFDIFDTLLTRSVLEPDDVFRMIEKKLAEEYMIKIDFVRLRKEAESKAWVKKEAYTNIHDIYSELPGLSGLSQDTCQMMKQLEIDLEYMLAIPRYDMLSIYNELRKQGKKIILVSDMYFTSEIMKRILDKCGYIGYEKIWISCENGVRKDQGNMWPKVLNEIESKSFIHVGDNPRSDWQALSDQGKNALWVINPRDAWRISEYFDMANSLNDGSLLYAQVAGMLVNGGFFNSPFTLNSSRKVMFNIPKQVGYSVFGPILYEFIVWVHNNSTENTILAFLAREGYILEQIYNIVYGGKNEEKEHCYFLASRRATGVAGVETWEDVRELVSKDFKGSLGNLLNARLGIKFDFAENEDQVFINKDYRQDIDKIMIILESKKEQIMAQFASEKQAYLSYVRSVIPEERWKDIVVVDVGYSGTIQYFLSKMLATKIGGCYLEMFGENKPDKIGCASKKMYGLDSEFGMTICINELFLEAVLEAPYGQLNCFNSLEGDIQPVFKAQNEVSQEIKSLQEGILEYCKTREMLQQNNGAEWSAKLMEYFCGNALNNDFLTNELAAIFKVEDDYCCSTTLEYSRERKGWC